MAAYWLLGPRGRSSWSDESGMAERKHKVFFKGQPWIPQDYFVNIAADSYEKMRAILSEYFVFLRHKQFAVVVRADGTYVGDDGYYRSLEPDCELVVLIAGEGPGRQEP